MTFQICPGLETGDLKSSTNDQAAHTKNLAFPEPKFSRDFKLNFAQKIHTKNS
jgi:hypothetical protein